MEDGAGAQVLEGDRELSRATKAAQRHLIVFEGRYGGSERVLG
jgi:hypothetical protein